MISFKRSGAIKTFSKLLSGILTGAYKSLLCRDFIEFTNVNDVNIFILIGCSEYMEDDQMLIFSGKK